MMLRRLRVAHFRAIAPAHAYWPPQVHPLAAVLDAGG
jgi:hypothetical protein